MCMKTPKAPDIPEAPRPPAPPPETPPMEFNEEVDPRLSKRIGMKKFRLSGEVVAPGGGAGLQAPK